MKYILGAILAAALIWCGYWFFAARAVERGLAGWLDGRSDAGWVVSWETLETAGFPYRFDTTITDLDLADPGTGVAWRAPTFQILALSYQPHHVIAFWPDRQSLATPLETIALTSQEMQGSIKFRPGLALEVTEAIFEFEALGMASTADWQASLADGLLAARQSEADRNAYDLAFRATELQLPGRLQARLARSGAADAPIDILNLDAGVVFDVPWDRRAIEVRRPQPVSIDLRDMRAEWGDLKLRVAGDLDIDAAGRPSGELTVKATNWRDMLEVARRSGTLPEGVANLLERGLNAAAGLAGNPKTLDVPVSFDSGRMSLAGWIPLGSAPSFSLR
ncbi:MAG: DUF2125 domain-containing protein [Pseudomonadota bacterium]